jgi:hypothetical protein
MPNLDHELYPKKSTAWFVMMGLVSAQTLPVVEASRGLDTRIENTHLNAGVPPTDRTIFTLLALLCMTVLSLLLGESSLPLDRAHH